MVRGNIVSQGTIAFILSMLSMVISGGTFVLGGIDNDKKLTVVAGVVIWILVTVLSFLYLTGHISMQ